MSRPRPLAPRVPPRVEALEPRLLLSGAAFTPTGSGTAAPRPGADVHYFPIAGFPPPSDLDAAPGTLAPEVSTPHETLATAQPLPDVDDGGVAGTLQPGEAIDVYRIPAGPGAPSLRLELTPAPDAGPARFQVLDGRGRVVADLPLAAGAATAAVLTPGLDFAPQSTLYAAVLRGSDPGAAATAPVSYRLRATRLIHPTNSGPLTVVSDPRDALIGSPATDLLGSGDSDGAGSSVFAPPDSSARDPGTGSESLPTPPGDQAPAAPVNVHGPDQPVSSAAPGTGPIAAGPLPSGPSRPAGGVFAVGGPTPTISRRDATRVDRSLLVARPRGLQPRGAPSGARRPDPATRGSGDRSDPPRPSAVLAIALEVLEGHGPAREASAASPGRTAPGLAVRVEDVPVLRPPIAVAAVRGVDPEETLVASEPPAEATGTGLVVSGTSPEDLPRRDAPPASVLIGAHGSAAMAFGLLWGSDLVVVKPRPAKARSRPFRRDEG